MGIRVSSTRVGVITPLKPLKPLFPIELNIAGVVSLSDGLDTRVLRDVGTASHIWSMFPADRSILCAM